MREKALNLLGLMQQGKRSAHRRRGNGRRCQRARGKARFACVRRHRPMQRKRASGYMYGSKAPLITVPFTKEEISEHVGKPGCSMAAVCDIGFADALMQRLCDISPQEYDEAAQIIQRRAQESKKRKDDVRQKNKRTGKRRTNA